MHFFTGIAELQGGEVHYLVADAAYGEPLKTTLDRLYDSVDSTARSNALLFIRLPVKWQINSEFLEAIVGRALPEDEFPAEPQYEILRPLLKDNASDAFARFSYQRIHLLYSNDFQHCISPNINPNGVVGSDLDVSGDLEGLYDSFRDTEIDKLVDLGHCKLPPLQDRMYRVPSGKFVRSFLRAGNLQRTREAVDAIFFWLLPFLEDCVGVVVDTWSISTISQNISRRLVDYNGGSGSPCPVEILGDYHKDKDRYGDNAASKIRRFVDRIEVGEKRVLILISVTQTGQMRDALTSKLERAGIDSTEWQIITLFKVGEVEDLIHLRDYSNDEDFSPLDSEADESKVVEIDGGMYFPAKILDFPKTIGQILFSDYSEFAGRYHDIEYARVHKDDFTSGEGNGRHHGIWLDTVKIFEHAEFKERLQAKLDGLEFIPKIVIYPPHEAARNLKDIVRSYYEEAGNEATIFFEHANLLLDSDIPSDNELKNKISGLMDSEHILFLDDSYVSGARINAYQRNIRSLDFSGKFHYLAGVARPISRPDWDRRKRIFLHARKIADTSVCFDAVEFLVLPYWDKNACPWCIERQYSQSRNEILQNGDGLIDSLFEVPNGNDALRLKPDSFAGPPNLVQSNVFCSVAGAIQLLRTEGKKPFLGSESFAVSTLIQPKNYFEDFTDSILIASIFRAAFAEELRFNDMHQEKERRARLTEMLARDEFTDLSAEMELAQKLKKC